ncbi:MAG: tyrosine--tRNA ligase [Solirubrobacteraceae bacterium]
MSGADAAGVHGAQGAPVLGAGAVDCLPHGELERKLTAARREGRTLRVKLGIDPTAPDIHLGHAVVLRKLRAFQDAGHTVVLIVGDFTARVGDPSGRSELRPMLSPEQISANADTFREQALKILREDAELLEVRRNSEWLSMGLGEALELLKTTTVAQLTEREDFAKRLAAHAPVSMLELLYPLLQGYDSYAVHADVELGGTDQKFNLLLGRDIQRAYGQEQQAVITMPILTGTDGSRKMSKSLGNQIGVTDAPEDMYGKVMSIPDTALEEYYGLLLGHAPPPDSSPRDAKRALAREIVAWLHSPTGAQAAEAHFDRTVVEGLPPEDMAELAFARGEGLVHLPGLIAGGLGLSRSDARRMIDSGGVSLDGQPVARGEYDVSEQRLDGAVLRAGKRRFVRLRAA